MIYVFPSAPPEAIIKAAKKSRWTGAPLFMMPGRYKLGPDDLALVLQLTSTPASGSVEPPAGEGD